jgi:GTPase SAR1 family protein
LRHLSYPNSSVILVVFSAVDPQTFFSVATRWLPEARAIMPGTPILLCGAKIELRKDAKVMKALNDIAMSCITHEQGEMMAKLCGCTGYVECSAFETGVQEVFDSALRIAGYTRIEQQTAENELQNDQNETNETKKNRCKTQ